ncbi:MAG: NADH-quinone oxidoreductase subunit N [Phycisphaerales bacterium]|nr:NADH-quinone oxidoreductase subunit N [Phycisphaerales bacterium]
MMSLLAAMSAGPDVPPMIAKLSIIVPEIVMFVGTCVVLMLGLSKTSTIRRASVGAAGLALIIAGIAAATGPQGVADSLLPHVMPYAKVLIAAVGFILLLLLTGTVDREVEAEADAGKPFDVLRANRAEFYAFFMFSLTGLMLCASADDLIWLFLALELTSLPTYVMVSISTARSRSQEAGVKYFFLGAFSAAMLLMGFTFIYGATGYTQLFGYHSIASVIGAQGSLGPIATLGFVMAIVGLCFKIAAVPMHFYTPDVYQGAAAGVSAMLAFVPKTAGFLGLMLLTSAVGWGLGGGYGLPSELRLLLWVVAALTMTFGNVLALMQRSVKRILAYSSIAHSGYMLVGIIAGPGAWGAGAPGNGLGAVLFYLMSYGVMNVGAFAVVASLEKQSGGEAEDVDDLRGLCKTHPLLGWIMVISSVTMLGLPFAIGFLGKFYLFTAGLRAGEVALIVVMGLNSAIAAFYYLRLAGAPLLEHRDEHEASLVVTAFNSRKLAGLISAVGVLALLPFADRLATLSDHAASYGASSEAAQASASQAEHVDARSVTDH